MRCYHLKAAPNYLNSIFYIKEYYEIKKLLPHLKNLEFGHYDENFVITSQRRLNRRILLWENYQGPLNTM